MADSVKNNEDELLTKLVDYYESSAEATQESRARAERDRDYYDHKQLSSSVVAALEKRGQPPTIINYVQKNINYLLGVERQTRSDPKAFPRTPLHEDAAHAASDAIRYVCDENDFDVIASDVYENILIEGVAGTVVEVAATKKGEAKISLSRIPWDRIFFDPTSREKDFSDATYKGYIKWMDLEEAEAIGEKYDYTGGFSEDGETFGESYEDKPSYQLWYDGKRKRVKVSYVWFLEKGVWKHAIYTKAGVIWGAKESPYLDEDGEPECNFVIASALIDRENSRYGYVRSMISQQDAINKRESKSVHLLSQRQTWSKSGAFVNTAKAKSELAKPDGHVEVNDHAAINVDFGVLSTGDMALGQFQLLQSAKADLGAIASTGSVDQVSGSASGRALEARSENGIIELTPFTDAHKQWKIKAYRCIWNKVKQFWPGEKWVRVTDDENNLKWVGLNVPVTMAEQMVSDKTGEPVEEVRKKYKKELAQVTAQQPHLAQVVETKNQVAELDVDIIIDEAPNVINFQNEQFMTIAKIAERRNDIPTNLIIKMSSLRNKDQILDEMNGNEQQQQQQAQAQQEAQQIEARRVGAETSREEAEAEKARQSAIQTSIENQIMVTQPVESRVVI